MGSMSNNETDDQGFGDEVTEKLRIQATKLMEQVNAGDYAAAMTVINDLSEVRDQSLYREVGRLTRAMRSNPKPCPK